MASIGISSDCLTAPNELEQGSGYVAARFQDFVLYGCYFSANKTIDEFQNYLGVLEESLSKRRSNHMIMAGYFETNTVEWHSGRTNRRGHVLGEIVAE